MRGFIRRLAACLGMSGLAAGEKCDAGLRVAERSAGGEPTRMGSRRLRAAALAFACVGALAGSAASGQPEHSGCFGLSAADLFTLMLYGPRDGNPGAFGVNGCTDADLQKAFCSITQNDKKLSDPIDLGTGEYLINETDLVVPGVGDVSFHLARSYKSRSGAMSHHYGNTFYDRWIDSGMLDDGGLVGVSPMGVGWDHSYNMRVWFVPNADLASRESQAGGGLGRGDAPALMYMSGSGQVDRFMVLGGTFANLPFYAYTDWDQGPQFTHDQRGRLLADNAPLAARFTWDAELTRDPATLRITGAVERAGAVGPVLRTGDGVVRWFRRLDEPIAPGRIDRVVDRNGNTMSFEYQRVTVGGGLHVDRLSGVVDALGNAHAFVYHDAEGAPAVAVAPGEAGFPRPGVARDEQQLAHLLWRVIDHTGREVEYRYEAVRWGYEPMLKLKLRQVLLPEIKTADSYGVPGSSLGGWSHALFQGGARRYVQYDYHPEPVVTVLTSPAGAPPDPRYGQVARVWSPNGEVVAETEYEDGLLPVGQNGAMVRAADKGYRFGVNSFRVKRQVHGRDINGQPVAYNYAARRLDGSELRVLPRVLSGNLTEWDLAHAVWVNDRRGTLTCLLYTHTQGLGGCGGSGGTRHVRGADAEPGPGGVGAADPRGVCVGAGLARATRAGVWPGR